MATSSSTRPGRRLGVGHWNRVGFRAIADFASGPAWHAPFVGFAVAQKEIAGRLESGTQSWEDEREWRAKRDGSLPRDHACRRQQPCLAQ
jgi:hypothetical protein